MTSCGTPTCSLLLFSSTDAELALAVTNNSQVTTPPAVITLGEQANEEMVFAGGGDESAFRLALPSTEGFETDETVTAFAEAWVLRAIEALAWLPFKEARRVAFWLVLTVPAVA